MTNHQIRCPLCKKPVQPMYMGTKLICANTKCENYIVYDIRKEAMERVVL